MSHLTIATCGKERRTFRRFFSLGVQGCSIQSLFPHKDKEAEEEKPGSPTVDPNSGLLVKCLTIGLEAFIEGNLILDCLLLVFLVDSS